MCKWSFENCIVDIVICVWFVVKCDLVGVIMFFLIWYLIGCKVCGKIDWVVGVDCVVIFGDILCGCWFEEEVCVSFYFLVVVWNIEVDVVFIEFFLKF